MILSFIFKIVMSFYKSALLTYEIIIFICVNIPWLEVYFIWYLYNHISFLLLSVYMLYHLLFFYFQSVCIIILKMCHLETVYHHILLFIQSADNLESGKNIHLQKDLCKNAHNSLSILVKTKKQPKHPSIGE